MRKPRLRAPSPALVVSLIALFVALGGSSYAAITASLPKNSVGTKQLKNGAVTATKIANGAVSAAKLSYSGTIPSGITVRGNWSAASSDGVAYGTPGFDEITLPAAAPVPFSSSTVNMGAGTTNGTDDDAACTGSNTNPTAPAGKLCFYVGSQSGISALAGFSSAGNPSLGGTVRVIGDGSTDNHYARGSWAYTAP